MTNQLIHNLTNSPNLVERIKGIDRDIDTLNAKVGSIPEGMDVGQSIIDLQDNKQDKLTAGEGISIENNVISNTQRSAEWGNITGDISNQADLQNELSSISDSIPTNTSDLTNDSGFITNSVNNLVNYYLKSETYTQAEVNNLIGSIQSFHYEIYPTIGSITTPLSNVLYLIGPIGTGSDKYEEYVYSNNNFVKIGETSIDLSGYVTIDNLNNALSNYTTTEALNILLAQKQNVLTAGSGISIDSNNEISADTSVLATKTDLNSKQNTLIAGSNIQIASDGKTISSTDTKYTAGIGINIDANNVISSTTTSVQWGNITGTLSDQTDLQDALDEKQDELIAGDNIQIAQDGKTISSTDTTYNAGEGIEIGTIKDYSAMRGPCPEGYHIPLQHEFDNLADGLCTMLYRLGLNRNDPNNYINYLFFPLSGDRTGYGGNVMNSGTRAHFWTASANKTSGQAINSYAFAITQNSVYDLASSPRADGYSIRPFKDNPVSPDSSWTILYDGSNVAEGAGIFHNPSLGLISIYDGTYLRTISDKNLGASIVYHNGDTLSEQNMGYFYQRGNNYGFASTGTITTSSTLVDTTGYGPGNYYNDDNFITIGSHQDDWSSVQNDNLRGGDTGVVTIENAISNTGVLSVNGQTGHVTVESGGKQSFFKTQAEYNALPASKESDGNLYIIVDTHIHFMPFEELIELTPAPDAILSELNKDGKGYAEYYYENGDIQMEKIPSSDLPRADAYLKIYYFTNIDFVDTNLTEQELIDADFTQEQIEAVLAGEWVFIRDEAE